MIWVQFPSFPSSCFRPNSCSISGKVQTTSERSIRHPVLGNELGDGASSCIHSPASSPSSHPVPLMPLSGGPLHPNAKPGNSADHAMNELHSKRVLTPFNIAWVPQLAAVAVDVAPQQAISCWSQGSVGFRKALPDTEGQVLPMCMSAGEQTPRQNLARAGVPSCSSVPM